MLKSRKISYILALAALSTCANLSAFAQDKPDESEDLTDYCEKEFGNDLLPDDWDGQDDPLYTPPPPVEHNNDDQGLGDDANYTDTCPKLAANTCPAAANIGFAYTGLSSTQLSSVCSIVKGFQRRGITDPTVIKAALAYAYLESGLKPGSTLEIGEQSWGLFQLGPETGYTKQQLLDPDTNVQAIFSRPIVDPRAVKYFSRYGITYTKGEKPWAVFQRWRASHPYVDNATVTQVFGLIMNPSSETLRGGEPYSASYSRLFGSCGKTTDPLPLT
ncbi:hypothetical protein JNK13_00505 [bacterium]|nr:hypothetical protein [bacterium]